jgi:hypothetical protein
MNNTAGQGGAQTKVPASLQQGALATDLKKEFEGLDG